MLSFITKNLNDIIYLLLLLLSVGIGPYYRSLPNVNIKKWVGTLLGILLILVVSGYNSLHPFISVLLGIISIRVFTVR